MDIALNMRNSSDALSSVGMEREIYASFVEASTIGSECITTMQLPA